MEAMMEDIKNVNIQDENNENTTTEATEVVLESEEMVEVALNENENATAVTKDENESEYTDSEMSGLTPEQRRRKEIFEKITDGILIALIASPIAIILYIFLWFILR
jgi:hypothetical protein